MKDPNKQNELKFPLEEVKLKNDVQRLIDNEDYVGVYKLRHEICKSAEILKEISPNTLDDLIESTYFVGDIDRAVLIGEEVLTHGHESFKQMYYMLLSYLSNCDIFEANSLIKKSKILNDSEIKPYYGNDEANYSGLKVFENDVYKCLCLVVSNLTCEIKKESIIIEVIDKSYLFYRFFDTLNLLNELGFSSDIVLKLSDDVRNVFMN